MIPDFTNPETCRTWFGKRQYLLDMGVDGFKTDGGEFVCTDEVSFYDGSTGKESRNCYPQQYTKAYTKFLGDNHVLSAVQATWDSTQHRAIGAGISSPQMMNCGMSFPQGLVQL